MKTKACTKCHKTKLLSEFHKCAACKDGHHSHCRTCRCEAGREYARARSAAEGGGKIRGPYHKYAPGEERPSQADYLLRLRFGITMADYDAMLEAQCGGCAICGKSPEREGKRLCVDHDHGTGEVRGLLCNECNAGIARFHDDPACLRSAACYVEK